MEYALILSALFLGLANSLHCVGMCGPIAFSLGLSQEKNIYFYLKNLIYQLGRVTTYTTLGLLIGFIGQGLNFGGVQKYVSIIAGVMMIIYTLLPKRTIAKVERTSGGSKLLIRLKSSLGKFIKKRNYSSLYVTGILNGLLPCGAVYVALTAALATGCFLKSTFFMFLFGLGTIPLMFLIVLFGTTINVRVRNKINKIIPYITILIGVIFILRGLELGIPFLSPPPEALQLNSSGSCHCH